MCVLVRIQESTILDEKNYIFLCIVFKFRQQTTLVIAVPMTVNGSHSYFHITLQWLQILKFFFYSHHYSEIMVAVRSASSYVFKLTCYITHLKRFDYYIIGFLYSLLQTLINQFLVINLVLVSINKLMAESSVIEGLMVSGREQDDQSTCPSALFSEQNSCEWQTMKGFTHNPYLQISALEYTCCPYNSDQNPAANWKNSGTVKSSRMQNLFPQLVCVGINPIIPNGKTKIWLFLLFQ